MKNFYSLLFLVVAGLTANTQSYLFSKDLSQYNEFTDDSTLNTELWDDEEFTVDLGFEFDAFEYTISQVTVSANGVITIDNGNETEDVQLGLFFTDLVDGGFSSVDYQTVHIQTKSEGDVGNRKLTIQWDNAAVWGAQEAYLDLQISLYETGDVSVQFGTNNLDSVPVGVGLIKKTSGINLADGVLLMGDPASASTSTLIGQKLMHAPNSGTLYHFSRSSIASVEDQTLEVEMYQNINEIKFDESYESIKLYNLNGAMVKQIRKDNSITIEDLTTGLYILVV